MPENSLLNWNTNKDFWSKSAEDIGGSFGLPGTHTKFIDKYDPFQENVANKQFSTGMSGLRKEGGQSLFEMLKSGRETTAKSGFAGSGAVSRDIDSTRKQLMERFGTQSEGMRTDRYGSIMGARKDYEKSIYDMMGTLAQSGVKFGEPKTVTPPTNVYVSPKKSGISTIDTTKESLDAYNEALRHGDSKAIQDLLGNNPEVIPFREKSDNPDPTGATPLRQQDPSTGIWWIYNPVTGEWSEETNP